MKPRTLQKVCGGGGGGWWCWVCKPNLVFSLSSGTILHLFDDPSKRWKPRKIKNNLHTMKWILYDMCPLKTYQGQSSHLIRQAHVKKDFLCPRTGFQVIKGQTIHLFIKL